MSKFQGKGYKAVNPGPQSPVQTRQSSYGGAVRATTHGGVRGYRTEAKGELFKLALSFMGGDSNFYEKDKTRYNRLIALVNEDDVINDLDWLFNFVTWLRREAGMRTVSMVIAIEAVRGRILRGLSDPVQPSWFGEEDITNRDLIDASLNRADEPAEAIAYWTAMYGQHKWSGRNKNTLPWPIRNGIADAAVRLWTEYSVMKYKGTTTKNVSMVDVLRLTHPKPKAPWQSALFEHIKTGEYNGSLLPMISARSNLNSLSMKDREVALKFNPDILSRSFKDAGMTWENVSEWSPEGMTGRVWDLIIPNMGLMALVRNLRNFDNKGISKASYDLVRNKLEDAEQIRKSGIFPYQFYSAYVELESDRWTTSLGIAIDFATENIPVLPGRTLIMVDMSGSMFFSKMSDRSKVTYANVASIFGAAWKQALGDNADLYQFGSDYNRMVTPAEGIGFFGGRQTQRYYSSQYDAIGQRVHFGERDLIWSGRTQKIDVGRGASTLKMISKFHDMGGTDLLGAVADLWNPEYDRVIILTDEQATHSGEYDRFPVSKGNVYVWNLGGYAAGIADVGKYRRHSFAGLTDQAFKLIPILESGQSSGWPWEESAR